MDITYSKQTQGADTMMSKDLRKARLRYLFMVKRYQAPLDLDKIEYFKSLTMDEFSSGMASTNMFNSLLEQYNRKRSTVSAKKDEGGNVDKLNIIIIPKRINRIYKRGNARIQIASANLRKLFVKAFYRCGKI